MSPAFSTSLRCLLVSIGTLAAMLAGPPTAGASQHVYWTNLGQMFSGTTIGRANLDGSGVDQSFISGGTPAGIAVNDTHIYWSNFMDSSIGRANVDGSGVDQSFISGLNPGLVAIAIDSGHVYWASNGVMGNGTTVGQANLDGSGVDPNFIAGLDGPSAVAVNASHIYWGNANDSTIGRANLDGTSPDQAFITASALPVGIALNDQYLYWGVIDPGFPIIGRADLDGTNQIDSFVSGSSAMTGPAVDASHLFWANFQDGSVGRANLDGTDVNQSFITGGEAFAVAVDQAAHLETAPSSVDFGSRAAGTGASATRAISVTNSGNEPLTVSTTTLAGAGAAQFKIVSDGCAGHSTASGASCSVGVAFDPQSGGAANASLDFTSNASSSSSVALTGTGTTTKPAVVDFTISSKRPRRSVKKLKFRFELSEPATVKLLVQRKYGRKQGRKCVPTTRRNRGHKRCRLYRRAGGRTVNAKAGKQTITFNASKLGPGAYRASLTATNKDGTSDPSRLIFFRPW